MGQRVNLITLRSNNYNIFSSNSETFLFLYSFINIIKYFFWKKKIFLTNILFFLNNNKIYLTFFVFFRDQAFVKLLKRKLKKNLTDNKQKNQLSNKNASLILNKNQIWYNKNKNFIKNKINNKNQNFATNQNQTAQIADKNKKFIKNKIASKNQTNYKNKISFSQIFKRRNNNSIAFLFKSLKPQKKNLIIYKFIFLNFFIKKNIKHIKKFYSRLKKIALNIFPRRFSFFLDFFTIYINLLLNNVNYSFISGIKITISGKLKGKLRSSIFNQNFGSVPIQTLKSDIDYAKAHVFTVYGVFGIKLWVSYYNN